MNAIKELATSFFIFKLTCSKVIYLKENTLTHSFKNHYSKRIKHTLQGFFYREIRCPTKGGNLVVSLKAKNFVLFPSVGYLPNQKNWVPLSPDHRPHIGKRVSLIAFRQILSKILPEACIFSNTIMTFLKNLIGTKSFIRKQCPAGLSPTIIPHYAPKHLWKTLGMGKNSTQKLTSFFCGCSHSCCMIFVSTLGFMYTYVMLVLINWCLLSVVFSMTKALNHQSFLMHNFYSPPSFNATWKTLLVRTLVFLFFALFFLFQTL